MGREGMDEYTLRRCACACACAAASAAAAAAELVLAVTGTLSAGSSGGRCCTAAEPEAEVEWVWCEGLGPLSRSCKAEVGVEPKRPLSCLGGG